MRRRRGRPSSGTTGPNSNELPALDELDPVLVWIADEADPRAALADPVRRPLRLDPLSRQFVERRVEVVDGQRDVAVAGPDLIRVDAEVVRQFELGRVFAWDAEEVVDRLVADRQLAPLLEAERLVEGDRPLRIGHAVARVDQLHAAILRVAPKPRPDLRVLPPALLEVERPQNAFPDIAAPLRNDLRRLVVDGDHELEPLHPELRECELRQEPQCLRGDPATPRLRHDNVAELGRPLLAFDARDHAEAEERSVVVLEREALPRPVSPSFLVLLHPGRAEARRHGLGDTRVPEDVGILGRAVERPGVLLGERHESHRHSRSSRISPKSTPSTHSPCRRYALRFTPSRTKPARSA